MNTMLSPANAPTAMHAPSRNGLSSPVDAAIAANATTSDSLGTGGKKASSIVTAKAIRYTQGDVANASSISVISVTRAPRFLLPLP